MIARDVCEAAFREAVVACDPAARVRAAVGRLAHRFERRDVIGIAMGKAALEMARGAGPVSRGVAVTNADDGRELPAGWAKLIASHPEPDERSLAAGDAVIELVSSTGAADVVLALISGGASALVERPAPGVTLQHLRDAVRIVMASGAPIHEINARRCELSAIKGGKLVGQCASAIVTFAISDVFDNDLAVIGAGPTIPTRPGDHSEVIAPMSLFAEAMRTSLAKRGTAPSGPHLLAIESAAIDIVAQQLPLYRTVIGWGEPTVRIPPEHGHGGRMQQLALELAKRLRGTDRSAFVVGSDGQDGPAPRGRPASAGAYVDHTTWDAILAAGIDPQRALDRRDAGTALHAASALVVTGPTGTNHGDVMVVG